jgi:hypothetical protein
MSGWTKTPPNSVRTIEPVGQASRQPEHFHDEALQVAMPAWAHSALPPDPHPAVASRVVEQPRPLL